MSKKKLMIALAAIVVMFTSVWVNAADIENAISVIRILNEEQRDLIPCWSSGGLSQENPEIGMSFVFCLHCVEKQGVPTGGHGYCSFGN